ncbi:MAG: hypothetical protein LQ338_007171, partial [Usnochroma carphineum]
NVDFGEGITLGSPEQDDDDFDEGIVFGALDEDEDDFREGITLGSPEQDDDDFDEGIVFGALDEDDEELSAKAVREATLAGESVEDGDDDEGWQDLSSDELEDEQDEIRSIIMTLKGLAMDLPRKALLSSAGNTASRAETPPLTGTWWTLLSDVDYPMELYLDEVPSEVQTVLGQNTSGVTDSVRLLGGWICQSQLET